MVEEEARDVIVEDIEEGVGLVLLQPLPDRPEGLEDRRPDRVVLLLPVEGEPDRRRVRGGDRAQDACHGLSSRIARRCWRRLLWQAPAVRPPPGYLPFARSALSRRG